MWIRLLLYLIDIWVRELFTPASLELIKARYKADSVRSILAQGMLLSDKTPTVIALVNVYVL